VGGHINHIEIVGTDKLLVVTEGLLEAHPGGEFLGSLLVARTDGDDIRPGVRPN
jgi:hypothetical protein